MALDLIMSFVKACSGSNCFNTTFYNMKFKQYKIYLSVALITYAGYLNLFPPHPCWMLGDAFELNFLSV